MSQRWLLDRLLSHKRHRRIGNERLWLVFLRVTLSLNLLGLLLLRDAHLLRTDTKLLWSNLLDDGTGDILDLLVQDITTSVVQNADHCREDGGNRRSSLLDLFVTFVLVVH